jgi:hypothetical protein
MPNQDNRDVVRTNPTFNTISVQTLTNHAGKKLVGHLKSSALIFFTLPIMSEARKISRTSPPSTAELN